ncbi:hypothetical protein C1645_487881 [Glomus cerebriforme]|uniref:Uncharacterized protein n=1 Tax=Glomus cerebriforme TaxID=658196 RepID=A0A397SA97_9GLOM|nr:hypothetical protein C1645_487881 [Glomus cerebriforme]
MILFLQTLLSNTFRYQLIDNALLDSDLNSIKKFKPLIKSPLNLEKIAKVFFHSLPYNRNLTEPIAIWRHLFFLNSILQSYINAKSLRQGKEVIYGLEDKELYVIFDDLISKRLTELKRWLKTKNMEDLKAQSELLLDMIGAYAKQINSSIIQ